MNVARGYARNFLLPRGLAEVATPALVRELEKRDAQRARHEAKSVDEARAIAKRLESVELRFDVNAGPTGSLFGSVTATNVADRLWEEQKIRVDRRKLEMDTIKRIGRYTVPVEVFTDVTPSCALVVAPEGEELPPEEELAALEARERAEAEAAEAEAAAEHQAAEAADRGARSPRRRRPPRPRLPRRGCRGRGRRAAAAEPELPEPCTEPEPRPWTGRGAESRSRRGRSAAPASTPSPAAAVPAADVRARRGLPPGRTSTALHRPVDDCPQLFPQLLHAVDFAGSCRSERPFRPRRPHRRTDVLSSPAKTASST